jgi:hypothetical protein
MFEGFVNPAMVLGTALAAVPLLIHLLNRQRHKPQAWAAMRFVLAAHRKTRRRVELENWLLLLLRVAAVVLLALAVARPFTGSESPLAGLTESRRDVAIVLDASASTGYRAEVDTAFERICERARAILAELDSTRGDRAHLILGGSRARLSAWGEPRNAQSLLESLSEPTDEHLDLASALSEVLEFAREEAAGTEESRVEVWFLTDLQRATFEDGTRDDPSEDQAGYLEVAEELAQLGIKVFVEDLGEADATPPNLAVAAIEPEGPIVGPGAPVDLRVRVANHGVLPRQAVRVALEVDGVRRPSQLVDVPARGTQDALFPLVFANPGDHVVRAILEGDRLAVDDQRVQVLTVPAPVRVLVVNGAPAPEVERDAAGRLMVVLDPLAEDGALSSPFLPREVRPRDLESGDVELGDFDLIWLVDVDSVTPEAVERLETRVAAGAGLVISLGDEVLPEAFNARFFRADGSGLAPAELLRREAVASRRTDYWRVQSFAAEHPALSLFAEERWRSLLTEAPIWQFIGSRPHEKAQVLATLDDPARSPLLVTRSYDRGSVYLWTSSIDDTWTALPSWGPFLVPFVYDLVRHAGTPPSTARALLPGETYSAEVREFPRRIELVRPDETRRSLDEEPIKVGEDRWQLPPVEGSATDRVGLYQLTTDTNLPLMFSVQLQRRESDLDRISPDELVGLHPAFVLRTADSSSEDTGAGLPRRGELWRWLALAALAALVGESLWAAWIGRGRRITR